MKSLLRKLRNRLFAGLARQSDLDKLYDQISGLLQIQNAMQGEPVLRPLRGWAISPDAMVWILADLQERESPTVVEFGSGQSTVILAAALKHRGGKLLSVEHDPEYMELIQRQATACGMSQPVKFIHAPLRDMNEGNEIRSYDTSILPELQIDLALVDGPPWTNGSLTRLTPLRWAAQHLKPGAAIFLDDTGRESEKLCLQQLMREYPRLRVTARDAEKGFAELRFV